MYIHTNEHTFDIIVSYLISKGCRWYRQKKYNSEFPTIYINRFNFMRLRPGKGTHSFKQLFEKEFPPTLKVGQYWLSIGNKRVQLNNSDTFSRAEVVAAVKALRSNADFCQEAGSTRYMAYRHRRGLQVGCTFVSRQKLEKIYSLMGK